MAGTSESYRFPRGDTPHQWKLGTWAEATVPKLKDIASHYGHYITYGELAEHLFETTGVRTDQRLDFWIKDVLGMVLDYCDAMNYPALPALVVQKKSGMVGPGFSAWLPKIGMSATQEPRVLEGVAAEERLKCYKRFGADVPPDAKAKPTREYEALLDKEDRAAGRGTPQPEAMCPTCFRVLPLSGQCDECD
ncbi:hypothetical protein GCM10011374_35650 [Kocuria dechangensis]|uniref:Uncharacterized protein n=1 Tax=Kocuria dechangensis TaxID=1176249 RepID=A0A917H5K6_9MICC|nr:hypothetical protein [Kocuria dechangensis]GGG68190.1 hypothetical protein GCM10011374_35650 [Kocuria dechangensis]